MTRGFRPTRHPPLAGPRPGTPAAEGAQSPAASRGPEAPNGGPGRPSAAPERPPPEPTAAPRARPTACRPAAGAALTMVLARPGAASVPHSSAGFSRRHRRLRFIAAAGAPEAAAPPLAEPTNGRAPAPLSSPP